jgi:hypothetical protein
MYEGQSHSRNWLFQQLNRFRCCFYCNVILVTAAKDVVGLCFFGIDLPYVIMYRDSGDIRRVAFSFCVLPFLSVTSNIQWGRAMDQANRCWLFSRWFWFNSKISRGRCMVHKVTLSQVFLGYFVLRLELFVRPPLLFSVICHSSEHHTHPTSFGTDCCSPQVLSESKARHLDLFSA